jgi:hypothetical protein
MEFFSSSILDGIRSDLAESREELKGQEKSKPTIIYLIV